MGIACPPGRNSGDGKGKGKGNVGRIAICAETDFPTGETLETTQGRIVSGFPRIINLQWSLSLVDITSPFHTEATVFFVATVSAIAADNAVQAGFDRGHRVTGFNQNPHLEHVAGFSIVAGGLKARCNDDPQGVLMKEKAVQREPPTINSAKQ